MTTLLIVAGEASGDLHGAALARELQVLRPGIRLVGAGGPRMREAGVGLIDDTTAYATIGVVEAFKQMHRYARLYRLLGSALNRERPDACVLIDYPDFNLRFASRARDARVPVLYYISPQIWAWRPGRVKQIRKLVRRMIVIFDFEVEFYRKHGVDAVFVGHPLLDRVQGDRSLRAELGVGDGPLIGLLPGSRPSQFRRLMPRMAKAADLIRAAVPPARFVVACAPKIDPSRVRGLEAVHDRAHDVMASSDLLITASGTATVEAAILGTPMIVTYVLNPVMVLLGKPFIRVKNYAMVNIIAGREIMPELYQHKGKPELLAREAIAILNENRLPAMREALAEVRRRLGEPGASRRAAQAVLDSL